MQKPRRNLMQDMATSKTRVLRQMGYLMFDVGSFVLNLKEMKVEKPRPSSRVV